MRKRFILILMVLITVLSGCGPGGDKEASSAQKNSAVKTKTKKLTVTVETQKIALENFSEEYRVAGKVLPETEISIGASKVGTVKKINFSVGDRVKTGDIIYSTDNENIIVDSDQKTQTAKNNLTTAEKRYEEAKKEYEDSKKLFNDGFVSKSEMDKQSANLENQKINYDNALNSYNSIFSSSRTSVGDTILKSPINGVISAINVQAGARSGPSDVVIADDKSFIVNTVVSGRVIDQIKLNEKVKITYGDKEYSGVIFQKSQGGIKNTDSFEVKIKLIDKDSVLKPGFGVDVFYSINEEKDQIVIPKKSVLTDAYGDYVYIVKDNKAVKKSVTQGSTSGGRVQIKGDVAVGDEIIITGQEFVSDGSTVAIKE